MTSSHELPVRPEATSDPLADAGLSPTEAEVVAEAASDVEFVDTVVEEGSDLKSAVEVEAENEAEETAAGETTVLSTVPPGAPVEEPRPSRDEPAANVSGSTELEQRSEASATQSSPARAPDQDDQRVGEDLDRRDEDPREARRSTYTVWSSSPSSGSHSFGPEEER